MKRYLKLALILALPLAAAGADKKFSAKVTSISDGDTIVVPYGKKTKRVHVYAVECPNKDQPFGKEATQFTRDLVQGETVTVRIVSNSLYMGELFIVGEVILPDGRNLGHELLKAGMAWYYEEYAPNQHELKNLEAQARTARRGLWSDKDPISPWAWRLDHPKKLNPKKVTYTGAFCASKNSMIYHPCNCKKVDKIKHEDFIRFDTEEEAKKSGRRHCKCRRK